MSTQEHETNCCVCHKPIETDVRKIGNRFFCERHYDKVFVNRKGIWITVLIGIIALFAFVGIITLLDNFIPMELSGPVLIFCGISLSLFPAIIWLGVFYRLDTLEPEPKSYIIGIFLLGAILANGIGIPLLKDLFNINAWMYNSGIFIKFIGSILIVGFLQEYIKYAGIRYTIFLSSEFDERTDGIIYGAAIGLGYATMLNIYYVISKGGVGLTIGVIHITIACLAHASFGGISGYFLGRAKFEDMPVWWLPAGVVLASICNGVIQILLRDVSRFGVKYMPINSLILAGVLAFCIFGFLFVLIKRINDRALKGLS